MTIPFYECPTRPAFYQSQTIVKLFLLKCINSDVILMIHNAELGQSKNSLHNAEYSASGIVADKEEKDTNYN